MGGKGTDNDEAIGKKIKRGVKLTRLVLRRKSV